MPLRLILCALVLTLGAGLATPARGQAGARPERNPAPGTAAEPLECEADSAYHVLDFWVGNWTVLADGREVGTNRIEKILRGCAIIENWRDAEGREGKSLFYYHPALRQWKQVWVTDQATSTLGTKEKHLIAEFPNGGKRFQGEIALPAGGLLLDRTTLTPEPDGRVRQVIEVSRDGGATWRVLFDAVYVRRQP